MAGRRWLSGAARRFVPGLALAGVFLAWVGREALRAPLPPPLTAEDWDEREPGRGRAARWPWSIPSRGWRDILWRAWRRAAGARLGAVAGGVTFYLLLATFPALAAFVSVYGLFLDIAGVEKQLSELARVFPAPVVGLIGQEMLQLAKQRHETLSAALVGAALASVWSANAGMKALFDGLNVSYGEVEKRPYLRRTLVTYTATAGSLLFLIAVTALTVAAPVLLHTAGFHQLSVWFVPIRWLLLYLLAAGGFAAIYRLGPSRTAPRWRWVICGGAAAALAWMAGSFGFSTYLANFTHFGTTYGSLGAVIGFMLWVWFTVMMILVGGELNAEIEHQTAQDTTVGPPAPLGARGATVADTVGAAFTVSPRQARDYVGRQAAGATDFLRRLGRGRSSPEGV